MAGVNNQAASLSSYEMASREASQSANGVFMSFKKVVRRWALCAIGVTAAVAVSMLWLDVPIARMFAANINQAEPIQYGLGSSVLVSGEMLVMALLVVKRLASGHLSSGQSAMLVAIVASLTAFSFNDFALKVFFGIPNPSLFIMGAAHSFQALGGNQESSFPSGHMALAAGFAVVFIRLYRRTIIPFSVALLATAVALVVGEWHFLSDVIAGTFIGGTAGLAAGELWIQHDRRVC
jgi:membrane-associated phospholipid phosphatase